MRIRLRLFAMLENRLPRGSQNHTMDLEVPEGTTPRQVIERMKIPPALAHLVLLDGRHLTPAEVDELVLRENDTLSIFPPIAGGA